MNYSVSTNPTVVFLHNGTSPATEDQQIAIAVVVGVLWVWSTFGNLLTILAITIHNGMLTKCNLFILSLAVSDLVSGCIASPLWLYRRTWGFYDWKWGQFLCKLFWFTDESTSYCTSLHIASFAVWRLIGVKWPLRFETIKIRTVKLWLIVLWILAIVFGGFVFSYFYESTPKVTEGRVSSSWPMCSIRLSEHGIEQHLIYYTFSSSTFMIAPLILLTCTSMLLVKELYFKAHFKSKLRRKKEKKASMQLALIASSFLFGYIPMTTYVMWTTRQKNKPPLFDYWFHVAAYFALRLSECLNPLIYNIASGHMRKASRDVLLRARTCGRRRLQSVASLARLNVSAARTTPSVSRRSPSPLTPRKATPSVSRRSTSPRTPRKATPSGLTTPHQNGHEQFLSVKFALVESSLV